MVAYNFQDQFAAKVESGLKTQTVRAPRKNGHAKPGDMLQLYTGMRQPTVRLLRESRCTEVAPILFDFTVPAILIGLGDCREICESAASRETFARADGFESFAALEAWFRKAHGNADQFSGFLIKWSNGL